MEKKIEKPDKVKDLFDHRDELLQRLQDNEMDMLVELVGTRFVRVNYAALRMEFYGPMRKTERMEKMRR